MMKKISLFFTILIILTISAYLLITNISADTSSLQGIQSTYDSAQQTLTNIQQTPDQIRSQYLSQEWGSEVARLPVIGQIHTFFTNYPIIFQILINEKYDISLTFFLTSFIWIFLIRISYRILRSTLSHKSLALIIAICISILIAQSTIIKIIVSAIINLTTSESAWWIRLIIWLGIIVIAIIFYYLDGKISKDIKNARLSKKKAGQEEAVNESKALIKGIREGKQMTSNED